MTSFRIELQGAKELKKKLLEMDRAMAGAVLRPMVQEAAGIVRSAAGARAPVRTGRLRAAIQWEPVRAGRGYAYAVVGVEATKFYARFLEFGLGSRGQLGVSSRTARRRARHDARREAARTKGKKMRSRAGEAHNMAARPFMRPAADESAAGVFRLFRDRLAAIIARFTGKG